MTEEQIKQRAEEYAKGKADKGNYDYAVGDHVYFGMSALEHAYIAGATENGIQWHDLRKNRLDLPRRTCTVLIFTDWKGCELKQFSTQTRLFGELTFRDVIAWCEIPKFEV